MSNPSCWIKYVKKSASSITAFVPNKPTVDWIRRYILYHQKRHPQDMGKPEVEQFLTHLAVERNVAASTQNQVLSAILFLYK